MRRAFLISILLLTATAGRADFLFERAGGDLVYDYHQNITWMKDANWAQTVGYDADGNMNFADSLAFIDWLNSSSQPFGISSWRLPKMNYITKSGTGTFGYCDTEKGHNVDIDSGEMAWMFYESLGLNSKFLPCTNTAQDPHGVTNSGPFININNEETKAYWYSDVYTGTSNTPEVPKTWVMHFQYGGQHADGQASKGPVWPVFEGDLAYQAGDELPEYSQLDIKPATLINELNPSSGGTVLVAMFGSADFDAADVDLSTVRFGKDRAMTTGFFNIGDRDNDTYLDMSTKFNMQDTGIACDDTEVDIYGETYSGVPFVGTDAIVTIGADCEDDGCHP